MDPIAGSQSIRSGNGDVPKMVAIDGCQVGCARAILEQAQVPLKNYIVLTDLGIEKNKNYDLQQEDIVAVKSAARTCFDLL